MEQTPPEVILLLGSNLGDRKRHLRNAMKALSASVSVTAVSRIYESEPFGPVPQPLYLNMAVRGVTTLEPETLLRFVKGIEQAEGRTGEGLRWGPRTLDIDIILMGDRVVRRPDLIVPHPAMSERRFCLLPLSEIAADAKVPPDGSTVSDLLERCTDSLEVYPL